MRLNEIFQNNRHIKCQRIFCGMSANLSCITDISEICLKLVPLTDINGLEKIVMSRQI